MALIARIVLHFGAIFIQLGLLPPAVFKAMQVNADTQFVQGFYLIKYIEYATVVNRVGYIKTNNM